jgi:mono/diheme cytochrome c family protein
MSTAMLRTKSVVLLLAIAAGGVWGCASTLHEPTSADARLAAARWPGTTLASLREGRRLYAATCSACHSLRDPASLPPERWEEEVREMRGRKGVHLGERDARLIVRYLSVASLESRSVATR